MSDVVPPIEQRRERTERLDRHGVRLRRLGICVLTAVVVVSLLNVVGQRSSTSTSSNASAALSVHEPSTVRGGLLYQARITVTARAPLPDAQLMLSSSWLNGLTLNTNEPSASSETSGPDGSLVLSIGSLQPGQTYVQYLSYQVDPTSYGNRRQVVAVRSHGADVITLHRTMTIVP